MNENQFLYKEYEECFKQLRFYDERQSAFVKYVMTISSITGTILLGLIKFFDNDIKTFLTFQSIITLIVFIGISIILLCMIQNRLYFTFTARQINAIRKYLLENECPNFNENQMYLSTNFSAFKLFSTHTLMIFGIAVVSSLYLSASAYSIIKLNDIKNNLIIVLFIFFFSLVIQLLFSFLYLTMQSRKNADQAIHSNME